MSSAGSVPPIGGLDDSTLVSIFEGCADETGQDLSPILRLLMVCKLWSRLVNPVVFRYLSLDMSFAASPRLEGLARQVHLQSTRGISVGCYMQTISCKVFSRFPLSAVRNMSYIFLNASNLRSLVFNRAEIPPSLFVIPLHASRATLRYLALTVTDEVLFEAQSIGQLQRLQSLDLISQADWSRLGGAWTMPTLTKLEWTGWMDDATQPRCYGDIEFLNKCRFSGLQNLMISLAQTNKPSVHQSKGLHELMQNLLKQSCLTLLGILLSSEQYQLILPHLAVPRINLLESPLEPLVLRHIHPAVHSLTLVITEDNLDGLWKLLDALCAQKRTLRLRRIKVMTKLHDLPEFTWNLGGMAVVDIPSQAADFVGRLVPIAIRLRARGIQLVDEHNAQLFA